MSPRCTRPELADYLKNFTGQDPVKAIECAFASDQGAGIGEPLFATLFFMGIGLSLTIRNQNPGPVIIASMFSAGLVAITVNGVVIKILALVLFFAIAWVSLRVYQQAQRTL